ncbi:MAG: two-component system response regulator [Pirellulaceae bacterium]|nr:MAG: two-component system response regulator [Pirellulaceae bacterium]
MCALREHTGGLAVGERGGVAAVNLVRPSLLITDDDPHLRETLRSVFEPRGVCTWLAGDGEEALRIVEHHSIHVVLLDMHMPRLDGVETLERLCRYDNPPACIAMSGDWTEELQQRVRPVAYTLLWKPVRFHSVVESVRAALWERYGLSWHE